MTKRQAVQMTCQEPPRHRPDWYVLYLYRLWRSHWIQG